jgi:hypothetical protein
MTHILVHQYINNKEETQNQKPNFERLSVKAVTVRREHYSVVVPEARCTLVLTEEQFAYGLKRAEVWARSRRQLERETQARGDALG